MFADRVRQLLCGFHGHDHLLQFEQERMFLKCVSCGHESPGWDLDEAPPVACTDAPLERRTLVRSQLISARRVA
jgi:hypothetical protein